MHNKLEYYARNLSKDLPAGLVVFLVALPLCLGISLASGAPLFAGILTGIVGGLVVSMLSGSSLSVSGPAAGLTVIVLEGIKDLGSFEAFLLAGFIAGALQLVLGYAKAGVIGMYFPSSVIRGMLAAIGLTLILKQIPHLLGFDTDFFAEDPFRSPLGGNSLTVFTNFTSKLQTGSLLIGLISLAVLLLWDSKTIKSIAALRLVPGALVVVVASVGLNTAISALHPSWAVASTHLVRLPVFSSPLDITGQFRFPDWSQIGNSAIYVTALTIALIASLETLLSIEAVDKIDPHKRRSPPNRELKAQGVGNMIASLIGGIPLTAVIVRSSANVDAGGQTRVASAVHGLLLLLSVLFLAPLINRVPLSALAAVLLLVGFKLTKPSIIRAQWKLGWEQFVPFAVTIGAVLLTDLLIGVAIGLLVGMFFILKKNYESSHFLHEETSADRSVVRVELVESVSFLNKAAIVRVLDDLADSQHVIIDASKSTSIDYDVLEAIQTFKASREDRNADTELIGVPEVTILAH